MELIINGETRQFDSGVTLEVIMDTLKVKEKVMACAVNMDVIKQNDWNQFSPKEGDKIELLHFVGGG